MTPLDRLQCSGSPCSLPVLVAWVSPRSLVTAWTQHTQTSVVYCLHTLTQPHNTSTCHTVSKNISNP